MPHYIYESRLLKTMAGPICGVDEVGRGPLAGPVVAAAVILDRKRIPKGLNDSKQLSEEDREALYPLIMETAIAVGVGTACAIVDSEVRCWGPQDGTPRPIPGITGAVKLAIDDSWLDGLCAVLADGSIVDAGGRCHKNKTGFDLTGLMVGSEGLLGVVTQATLRIIPHPPMRAMLSAGFNSFAEAANAVQRILGSGFLPSALEIADKFTLRAAREYLGESVTPKGDAHLLVEIDGQTESVKGELQLLAKLVRELGCICIEEALGEEACEAFWKLRREFSYSLRNTGLIKLNEDIVVPRGKLVELVEFAEQLQAEFGFPVACFGHAGDGNIHVNIMVPTMDDPPVREKAEQALDRLFHQIIAWRGAITGEHGIGIAKARWYPHAVPDAARAMHTALKTALDPNGILNPGKFIS